MENDDEKNNTPKEIQIVPGKKDDLEISPVYDNLEIEKPEDKKPKYIIIPENKEEKKNTDE